MRILVIIPAYNEEKCIKSTVDELITTIAGSRYDIDYVVINDCSTDETLNVLINERYNYISGALNLGIGGAVQCGYKYALEKGYDIAIQLDGDGQHDPAYIDSIIEPIVKGKADISIGSRFIAHEGFQSSAMRRLGIRFLDALIKLCTGYKPTDCTSGFRAVSGKYIKMYSDYYPVDYPEPEAMVMAALDGALIKEVPVVMRERTTGRSSIRPIHSVYYMIKVSIAILLCRLGGHRK